jgi:signal transduction histidine kinase
VNVVLISNDTELYKLCRETLAELAGSDCKLVTATTPTFTHKADLYIWDIEPQSESPQGADFHAAKHLFLVHRNDLARFQPDLPGETSILLKPVSRATLVAFLDLAICADADELSATNFLRADRDKILQCLIQTNLRIQQYDQDRTNFLTRAVHDFRAPLTAVTGYCGLLLSEVLGPLSAEQGEVLRRMQHSAKRLSRMSSAFFQLSVHRHIKNQPALSKGNLQECIEQAIHEIAPFNDAKRISVTAEFDPEPGPVYFEQCQMEQIFINLLDNACKFTPRNGEISIQGYPFFWERRTANDGRQTSRDRRHQDSRQANAYRIDIQDSGPPIPAEYLETIFEEYTSYAGGQDRSGGGLGLAICRMIAAQHEGRIWAENTESGPRFCLVLPVRPVESGMPDRAPKPLLHYMETR